MKHPFKRTRRALIVLVAAAIALRAAAPFVLERVINDRLAKMDDYRGRISDVDLALIRGAYQVEGLRVQKRGGKVPAPLFAAREIDLSVQWGALFQGEIVAEIDILGAELNFVDAPTPERRQREVKTEDWRKLVNDLVPLRINRLAVRDGEVHFRNFSTDPPADIYLHNLSLEALDLSNTRERSASLPSTVRVRGDAMKDAPFKLDGKLNALKNPMDFDVNLEVKDLPLAEMNDFFRSYAAVDIERGTMSLALELAAKDGKLAGYVKPVLKDMEVVETSRDTNRGPFALLWQSFTGTVADLVQKDDTQGARVPIQGSLDNPEVGTWAAIGSALGHAFGGKKVTPEVTGTVNLESAEQAGKKGE